MNQTYIYKNDQQLGPFDDALILSSLNNGSFDYSDQCWREGWDAWRPLESIYPRPNTSHAISNHASDLKDGSIEEKTVWTGRPSLVNLAFEITIGLFFLLALLVLPFIPLNTLSPDAGTAQVLKMVLLIIAAIAVLFSLIKFASKYFGVKYKITNQRVMIETGLIVKSSNQLRIKDIRSINVTKSGINGLLLGLGSVELSTAATDDAEVVFAGITDADKIRDLVSGLQ